MRTDRARMRVALAGLLVIALALFATACGGGGSSTSETAESTESTEAEPETETETEGGEGGAIVSNPENGKVSLTIGSKNFPEQEILGEIYAQALTAAGYKVKSDLNLGSETVALKAVKSGADLRLPRVRQHGARPRSSASNPKKSPPTPPKPTKRRTPNSKRKA